MNKKDDKQIKILTKDLPRRTLEDSLKIAEIIRDNYAGKSARWEEIANVLGVSPNASPNRYPLWAAEAYGIILKNSDRTYSLAEIGRKILSQNYDGEREEGIKKALFIPSIMSRFYTDYDGSPIPNEKILPNVLENKYNIPRDRIDESINIIMANARFAGSLTSIDGKDFLNFKDTPLSQSSSSGDLSLIDFPKATESTNEISSNENEQITKKEDWEKICFVITPIGIDDSEERKHADTILKHMLDPILKEFNLKPIRADKISKPGIITKQIIEYIAYSKVCIADLSFSNPNAFYELGVRHAFKLATIQVIRKLDHIPFDVSQGRTIIIDTSDPYTIMDRFDSAKNELREHLSSFLKGSEKQDDNPISLFLPSLKVMIK